MRAFESAVDTFGMSKVPRYRALLRGAGAERHSGKALGKHLHHKGGAGEAGVATGKPVSGCYLCPASDHYANYPKFHPKPADRWEAPSAFR